MVIVGYLFHKYSPTIAKIYAKLIFDKLDLDYLPEIQNLQLKATNCDSIKQKINHKIVGLNEFKPSGYKSQIKLLESLLK